MRKLSCLLSCALLMSCSQSTSESTQTGSDAGLADGDSPEVGSGDAQSDTQTPEASKPDGTPEDSMVADVSADVIADTATDATNAEASIDATADSNPDAADGATCPARCGATPYCWLQSDALGNILEDHGKSQHTVFDLTLGLLSLMDQKAIKTKRLPKNDTGAKLIRYQTQDRGKLIDATALVTYPSGSGTFPILLILHGTSGFTDSCAPTLGMTTGSVDGFDSELGMLMSLYASFGYITVFPDYIGLKSLGSPTGFMHPYLVAEPTAIASLDAVRAARKMLAGAEAIPGDVVVIGGSQGGHAAAFVNRYAPHYAPELTIRGSVWDVPPTDMMEQARAAWGTTWVNASDNVITSFAASQSWYGSAPGGMSEVLQAPYDSQVMPAFATQCGGLEIPSPTLETVVTPKALAAAKEPEFGGFEPWACYLRENSLSSTSVPRKDTIPSLFLLGEKDNLVNTTVERAAFSELCAQGNKLVYLECAGAGHTQPLVWAFDQTLDFLDARLRGDPLPANTCQLKAAEKCTSQP